MIEETATNEILHSNLGDLEDFFENAAVGLHIVDDGGIIVRANKAELAMLGYEAEEYIGRHISEFHMDSEVIQEVLARLGRGEELIRFPARLRAADGSIRHGLITSNGQFSNGKFVSTRCFTVDVTAEKLAQTSARDNELRFQNMLESLPTAIYTTDAHGHVTFFNEAAAHLAGRHPEIGIDQWCITWRLYRPDGSPLPHHECPMAIAIKEKRSIRGMELIVERPDGSRARVIPYPTPLFDINGELIRGINMLVDISARYKADQELARLGAVVADSDDAVIGLSLQGAITHWNGGATQLYSYKSHEMLGQPISRIIPPELRAKESEIFEKLKLGERVKNYETERIGKDERRISISLSASSLRDEKGNIIGITKVGRDITERIRAEQLQQLLMNELNHRVKNTLATVQAIAHRTVRSAKSPGDFAMSFTARLQALSKAHNLLTQSSWQGADLVSLIRDQLLCTDMDERISYAGPSVVLEPQIALHLSMVLHELGTNARKYGALSVPRGRVAINWSVQTTRADDSTLLLKWQEHDGPAVTSPLKKGFGTTLIQQSIQTHGGEVLIDFSSQGLTCEIKVPSVQAKMKAYRTPVLEQTAVGEREQLGLSIGGKRILIVDDEPLLLMDLEDTLTNSGCIVVGPASTVPQAKVLIDEAELDAALLDVNLGGQRVDELAAALTQRNIPFAFVTGYGREGLPPSFRHAPLLGKPFSHHQVLDVIGQLFANTANIVHFGRS